MAGELYFEDICKEEEYEEHMQRKEQQLREDWEHLAAVGFSKGVRVRSLTTMTHWKPRPLRAGDGGVVLGPGDSSSMVGVSFDGEPPLKGDLRLEDICKEEEYE